MIPHDPRDRDDKDRALAHYEGLLLRMRRDFCSAEALWHKAVQDQREVSLVGMCTYIHVNGQRFGGGLLRTEDDRA